MPVHFTRDHEWIRIDGDTGIVGITNYAQEQLGDVVFVELPESGKTLNQGDQAAVVESVKAASEVYAPAGGEVIEVNETLVDEPAKVNAAAMTEGWFFKVKLSNPGEVEGLMDTKTYQDFLETLK